MKTSFSAPSSALGIMLLVAMTIVSCSSNQSAPPQTAAPSPVATAPASPAPTQQAAPPPAQQSAPPPAQETAAASTGQDFQPGTAIAQWTVVDPDPKGLNCRLAIPPDPMSAEVSHVFKTGETLTTASHSPEPIADNQGRTWVWVLINARTACVVRANSAFIKPL